MTTMRGVRRTPRNGRQPSRASETIFSVLPSTVVRMRPWSPCRHLDDDLVPVGLHELEVDVCRRRRSCVNSPGVRDLGDVTGPPSRRKAPRGTRAATTIQARMAATTTQATTRMGRAERRMTGPPDGIGPRLDAPSAGSRIHRPATGHSRTGSRRLARERPGRSAVRVARVLAEPGAVACRVGDVDVRGVARVRFTSSSLSVRTTLPGLPITSERSGMVLPSGTSAFAPIRHSRPIDGAVQHDRLDADQRAVADGAAVQHRLVADGHVARRASAGSPGSACSTAPSCTLDARPIDDRLVVGPQDRAEPDRRAVARARRARSASRRARRNGPRRRA